MEASLFYTLYIIVSSVKKLNRYPNTENSDSDNWHILTYINHNVHVSLQCHGIVHKGTIIIDDELSWIF